MSAANGEIITLDAAVPSVIIYIQQTVIGGGKVMKNRKFRAMIVASLVLSLVITSTLVSFGASGTKKMTVYNKVCKVKNSSVLYCSDNYAIYKVDTATGGVLRLTQPKANGVFGMKVHKGYVYFLWYTSGTPLVLSRVKTSGKAEKELFMMHEGPGKYAVKGKKIYVQYYDDNGKRCRKSMNLKGKKVRRSGYKVKMKSKDSNIAGYTVFTNESPDFSTWDEESTGTLSSFLTGPDGSVIHLGTYTSRDFEY